MILRIMLVLRMMLSTEQSSNDYRRREKEKNIREKRNVWWNQLVFFSFLCLSSGFEETAVPTFLTSNSVFPQVRMLTMDNDRLLQEREREKANNSRSVFFAITFSLLFWPVYHIFGPFCPIWWTCIVLLAFHLVLFWSKFHRLLNHSSIHFLQVVHRAEAGV